MESTQTAKLRVNYFCVIMLIAARIWVSLIVDNLAAGCGEEEILEAYPSLSREDIRAALVFAAEMARERYVDIPLKV
ncbi:DUF433 domain-containing protein [Dehalococcoidia bacterium]|nr:DUF433 domain-containing protein [Dehalococcoidia bacterium]